VQRLQLVKRARVVGQMAYWKQTLNSHLLLPMNRLECVHCTYDVIHVCTQSTPMDTVVGYVRMSCKGPCEWAGLRVSYLYIVCILMCVRDTACAWPQDCERPTRLLRCAANSVSRRG
jgi:hypothetical protein